MKYRHKLIAVTCATLVLVNTVSADSRTLQVTADLSQEQPAPAEQLTLRDLLSAALAWAESDFSRLNDERFTDPLVVFQESHSPEIEIVRLLGNDIDQIVDWLANYHYAPTTADVEMNATTDSSFEGVLLHIESVLADLAMQHPAEALVVALTSDALPIRDRLVYPLLNDWATVHPHDAMAWLQAQGDNELLETYAGTIMYSWIESDSAMALVALDALPDFEGKVHLYGTYATHLAFKDPQAAYTWANTVQDADTRELVTSIVASEWSYQDPTSFLSAVESLPMDMHATLMAQGAANVAYTMAAEDPFSALAWTDSLEGQVRTDAILATFNVWYANAPKDALEYRQQYLTEHEENLFLSSVAYDLPVYDLEFAQSLFDSADNTVRMHLTHSMVAELYRVNPEDAVSWVDQLPQNELLSSATISLSSAMALDHPEEAWDLLRRYAGDDRLDVLENGLWMIAYDHPELVENWSLLSDLTPAEQSRLDSVLEAMENPDFFHGC